MQQIFMEHQFEPDTVLDAEIQTSIQHRKKKNRCHNRAFVLDGTTGNKINTSNLHDSLC